MTPPTPRQTKRQQKILATVRSQLAARGLEALSMRDTAKAAGVSPTTLYNLFKNKDRLVLAALQDVLAQIGEEVAVADKRGLERLILRAEASSRQIQQTPRYAEAMTGIMLNAEPADPISLILLRDSMLAFDEIIAEMQALGEARQDINRRAYARLLAGNAWSSILLWLKGFITLDELPEDCLRSQLLAVWPIMTPRLARRYNDLLTARRPERRVS